MRSPEQGGRAFTVIELVIALGIVGVLTSIASIKYAEYIERARVKAAIGDLASMAADLDAWIFNDYPLPTSLADVGFDDLRDPWGRPYQYLAIKGNLPKGLSVSAPPEGGGGSIMGEVRKDRFLVPINSDYDLYSLGKDGESKSQLSNQLSLDDVIRANGGGYYGLAEYY